MGHHHEQGHRRRTHRDQFGNPADLDAYIARQEDPSRDEWQKPNEVLRALGVRPGQRAGDIGGGPGYFSLRLARRVGPRGCVYAVEVEPRILEVLRQRIEQSKLRNVTPVLALPDDPLLPRASCDLILVTDTYHHFPDGPRYLRRLVGALRRGGRIVNIDFKKVETPVGPPVGHRIARAEVLKDARRAGLRLVAEHTFLPYQYFLVFKPRSWSS